MKVDDTPYDVWSAIAAYLPSRDVENLCGVSRQSRLVGLERRFKNVRLHNHDKGMKRLCEILRRDEIAPFVRKLIIEPWLVQPRTKGYASRSENMWNLANTFFNPKYMEQEAEKRIQKRIQKDIRCVTAVVQGLNNIQEYHILCDERKKYHRELVEAFLSPTLTTISLDLNKLTLKVPFDLLQQLSYIRLPQLRSLDICLCTGEARMERVNTALDGYFVFIHNLRDLEHLGISATSSSRYLDLSYLSQRWGTFSHLKSFSLSIPFNGGLLTQPEMFCHYVIKPHARTVEKLRLSGTCCGPSPARLPPDCQFWVQRILKASFDTPFPYLREVELAVRPLKAEYRVTDLQTFLRLRASTLEKLCLTDRTLDVHELEELFKSLCAEDAYPAGQNHTLESLDIKVDYLSAEVIVLIARRFPQLHSLGLVFSDLACSTMDPFMKRAAFQSSLSLYKSTIFASWNLRYLKLAGGPDSAPCQFLERIFRINFPSTLEFGNLPSPRN